MDERDFRRNKVCYERLLKKTAKIMRYFINLFHGIARPESFNLLNISNKTERFNYRYKSEH